LPEGLGELAGEIARQGGAPGGDERPDQALGQAGLLLNLKTSEVELAVPLSGSEGQVLGQLFGRHPPSLLGPATRLSARLDPAVDEQSREAKTGCQTAPNPTRDPGMLTDLSAHVDRVPDPIFDFDEQGRRLGSELLYLSLGLN
jgi:hypothetical protein